MWKWEICHPDLAQSAPELGVTEFIVSDGPQRSPGAVPLPSPTLPSRPPSSTPFWQKEREREKTLQPQVCYSLGTLRCFVWGLGWDGTLVLVVVAWRRGEDVGGASGVTRRGGRHMLLLLYGCLSEERHVLSESEGPFPAVGLQRHTHMHTHARTHTMKIKIGCPPSPSVEDKSQLNASASFVLLFFFVARH